MKKELLAVVLLLGGSGFAQAPSNPGSAQPASADKPTSAVTPAKIDPAKEADIRKLMQLTGADKMAAQMMSSMEVTLKPSLIASLPPGEYRAQLVDLFIQKLRGKVSAMAMEVAVPAYDKYFTDEEIRQLTAFYETPIGQKTATVMPQLMTEIMTASQSLGQQLGLECVNEVFAEHPELKQQMEQAGKTAEQH